MMDNLKEYSASMLEFGQVIAKQLGESLVAPRDLMKAKAGAQFADNAILHGLFSLLSAHLSYIIWRSSGTKLADDERRKLDKTVQHELALTIKKLLGDHIKDADATIILFSTNEDEEEQTHGQEEKEDGEEEA